MKLIATLGATPASHKHTYKIDDKKYDTFFSFEAIKEHYKIHNEDVIVIGTEKTREVLDERIANYRFVEVDANDLDNIFHKILKVIEKNVIVDLTQSFRSIPFGVFLALNFSKSLGKYAQEIFYAQALDHLCNPKEHACSFLFVSLLRYDHIADMARMINTFTATLLVLDKVHSTEHLERFRSELLKLSKAIFDNHVDYAIEMAKVLRRDVNTLINNEKYKYIHEHFKRLQKELEKILSCEKSYESEKLLEFGAYLLGKDITLHAITLLYESMTAFLDEELDISECNKITTKRGKKYKATIYQRRNCLKKALKNCHKIHQIIDCNEFSKRLKKIDELRNISAHGFTSDNTGEDIAKEVKKTIEYLRSYYPRRLSTRSPEDKLSDAFANR